MAIIVVLNRNTCKITIHICGSCSCSLLSVCVLIAGLSWVPCLCSPTQPQSLISLTQARWGCKSAINHTLHNIQSAAKYRDGIKSGDKHMVPAYGWALRVCVCVCHAVLYASPATQTVPQQQGATVRPQVTLAQPSMVTLRGQPHPRVIMSQPQAVKQLQTGRTGLPSCAATRYYLVRVSHSGTSKLKN